MERIISKYPSSQSAVKIIQGDAIIGSYTLTEFKESIVPQAKMKADAEENPFACALLVAKTKASALVNIAWEYAETGQYGQALEIAKTIEDVHLKALALADIAGKYAEAGQKVDDRARETLHEIIRELE